MFHHIRFNAAGRAAPLLTGLLTLLAVTGTGAASNDVWEIISERWYVISLDDVPAGAAVDRVERRGEHLRTTRDRTIRIRRAGEPITLQTVSTIVESSRGTPLECGVRQRGGDSDADARWTFEDQMIVQHVRFGAESHERRFARSDTRWLPPQAAKRFAHLRQSSGAESYSYHTVLPEERVEPIGIEMQRNERGTLTIDGRTVDVTRWSRRQSGQPHPMDDWYDDHGVLVQTTMHTGLGCFTLQLASRESAARALQGEAPDIIASSMVRLDEPIAEMQTMDRATYLLQSRNGAALPMMPSAGAQICRRIADDQLEISIDPRAPQPATKSEQSDERYRRSSVFINSDDAHVRSLAERGVRSVPGPDRDPRVQARALCRFVHRFIQDKGFGTAFATAAQTARSRQGDCSEHAVLLAALLRAVDVPSRVVTGLVYLETDDHAAAFGWHMWTQALIDGHWIDLDATAPDRLHVGHIAAATTALEDQGSSDAMDGLLQVMGNLQISLVTSGDAPAERASDE